MGLLSWFFPSPADRMARARAHLEAGRYRDARDELDGIDGEEAGTLRRDAENGLARLNLEAALTYGHNGNDERVSEHLDRAEQFHRGGLEEEFRTTRRKLREIREQRREEFARKRAEAARLAAADPLGLVGRGLLADSSEPDLSPDDEERRVRLQLAIENYPADLRGNVATLGPAFAAALLDLEDGRPDLAWQALLALPTNDPLVCFEAGRAAWALGDPAAAARAFRGFAAAANGHRFVGNEHTGALLAQCTVEAGDPEGAIAILRSVRAAEPKVGGVLLGQLLLGSALAITAEGPDGRSARLAEAEEVLVEVVQRYPRESQLYGLLARTRLAAGQRVLAMRALEQALEACCSTPGKCGYKPPDIAVMRQLSTLYLEDHLETARALELAETALSSVKDPEWEDLYLDALVARAQGRVEAREAAAALWESTGNEDPRRDLLERHLPRTA